MKTLSTILFAGCLTAGALAQTPDLAWARSMGGTYNEYSFGIASDNDGNVFSVGAFYGSTIFSNDGSGTVYNSNGNFDIFIQKVNPDGALEWARTLGSTSWDFAYSVALDEAGSAYIVGEFQGGVDFDPGPGVDIRMSNGESDGFVLKLDSDGDYQWVRTFGGSSIEVVTSISATDTELIVGGYFRSPVMSLEPGNSNFDVSNAGGEDAFVFKIDANNNLSWVKAIGGVEDDRITAVCPGLDGSVISAGYFSDVVDFDPGVGVESHISEGLQDAFVMRMDDTGDLQWVNCIGGYQYDNAYSVICNTEGEVFVTGTYVGTVDLDPTPEVDSYTSNGSYDCFLQKLDPNGGYLWAKSFGGIDNDVPCAVRIDNDENILVSGYFRETVDFNPGAEQYILASNGGRDAFIMELESDGSFLWAESVGGTQDDCSFSLTTDPSGNVFSTGYYTVTADFSPGASTYSLTANGGNDIFIQKLRRCNATTTVDQVEACGSYTWIDGVTYTSDNSSATYTTTSVGGCDSTIQLQLNITNINNGVTVSGNQLIAQQGWADYQWINCADNTPIPGATDMNFIPQTSGEYAVIITMNNCQEISDCIPMSTLGIAEGEAAELIRLAPNPSDGSFTLVCPEALTGNDVTITNSLGKVVYHDKVSGGEMNFQLALSSGLYILVVGDQTERLVIR